GAPTSEPAAASNGGLTQTNGLSVASVKSCDAPYAGLIKEIAAVDPLTVRFTMCSPDPAFQAKVAFSSFGVEPSEYLEKTGGTGDLLEKPVGTGPYMLDSWTKGDNITFKRNDNYWGDKAKAATLVFRWSTEAAQRLLELQSGTVDGIDNIAPDDFETVKNDPSLQLIERPALNTMYVGMNNTIKPFDDEKVRQAIAMGIDRDRIVKNFYPGGSEVSQYFTPCAIPNGCGGQEWYKFDPAAAKKLLAEAGFPDGFETEIAYRDVVRGYLPQPNQVAEDLQAQLKQNLNITVKINKMESTAFLDAASAGKLGLFILGWGADYPDQTNFLDFHFGAGANDSFGAKYDDLTAVLKQAASLAGDDKRKPLYEQANDLVRQHVPMVPVAHGGSAVAFKADVKDAQTSPLGNEVFAAMDPGGRDTFVWMQNAEPGGLYCGDETDGESLRACNMVTEGLLAYEKGGTKSVPALATSCDPNEDLTVWTCKLRENVKFHDGSDLDANDVVMSYYVQWDAASPLHKGRTGNYDYFSGLWGGFMNAKPAP
ncbi:MAG TPA: ABC transporter substrate-binding protein, partial [Roseiflexaceae bacterium]|nr:ABC transporter substrate-binding protein [Roseiflexaceae bacterium]